MSAQRGTAVERCCNHYRVTEERQDMATAYEFLPGNHNGDAHLSLSTLITSFKI